MAKVASTPGAIGYVSLDVVDDSVKAVKLEGVEPTAENILSGDYALYRPFVMATKGEISEQSDLVKALFDYDFAPIEHDLGINCFSRLSDYHAIHKKELMYNKNVSEKVRALSRQLEAAKDEKADKQTVDDANAAIQTMAGYTVTEAQIENLITAKGYTDCVAFLGEDSISVVVSAMENGMTDADAARIGEIVMEQTGFDADQIKIIEAE